MKPFGKTILSTEFFAISRIFVFLKHKAGLPTYNVLCTLNILAFILPTFAVNTSEHSYGCEGSVVMRKSVSIFPIKQLSYKLYLTFVFSLNKGSIINVEIFSHTPTFIIEPLKNPTIYNQAFALILYTGIRRAELSSLTIENGWVHLISAKQRKNCKVKSREMPVSPMLQRILPLIQTDKFSEIAPALLTRHFKKICPNHHLHDLRHTFITRAQECGIRREIVSLWAGHKADSSITSLVYTHLNQNKEVQTDEMKKFDYQL